MGMLGKNKEATTQTTAQFADVSAAVELLTTHVKERDDQHAAQIVELKAEQKKTNDQLADLMTKLTNAPAGTVPRPTATGGNSGAITTDC